MKKHSPYPHPPTYRELRERLENLYLCELERLANWTGGESRNDNNFGDNLPREELIEYLAERGLGKWTLGGGFCYGLRGGEDFANLPLEVLQLLSYLLGVAYNRNTLPQELRRRLVEATEYRGESESTQLARLNRRVRVRKLALRLLRRRERSEE